MSLRNHTEGSVMEGRTRGRQEEEECNCSPSASLAEPAVELDTHGYSLQVWSNRSKGRISVGDDVFVCLNRDTGTRKAAVLSDPITDPDSPFHGRVKVQYYDDGSTYHVRRSKMIKVLYGRQHNSVVLVPETEDMRVLARSQLEPGDRAIDIGSSYGICTDILAKHCGAANVLGIEISSELLAEARNRYPTLEFRQMDVLSDSHMLREVCQGATKVFLDLGGDRSMEAIATVLPIIQGEVRPRLVVVKNRELARFAAKHSDRQSCRQGESLSASSSHRAGGHSSAPCRHLEGLDSFWAAVEERCRCRQRAKGPREQRAYHLQNHDGGVPVRFLKYPLHYKHRDNGSGTFICRFHNYGVCARPSSCLFDHSHCHHCGREGHIAKNCLEGLPPGTSHICTEVMASSSNDQTKQQMNAPAEA